MIFILLVFLFCEINVFFVLRNVFFPPIILIVIENFSVYEIYILHDPICWTFICIIEHNNQTYYDGIFIHTFIFLFIYMTSNTSTAYFVHIFNMQYVLTEWFHAQPQIMIILAQYLISDFKLMILCTTIIPPRALMHFSYSGILPYNFLYLRLSSYGITIIIFMV